MPPHLLSFLFRVGLPVTVDRILTIACFESRNLGHNFIGTEHILCALVRLPDPVIPQLLARREVDLQKIRDGVISVDAIGPHRHSREFRPQTPRLKRILPIAGSEATPLSHLTIAQSLFLGILIEGQGVAARVLKQLAFDIGELKQDLETNKSQ